MTHTLSARTLCIAIALAAGSAACSTSQRTGTARAHTTPQNTVLAESLTREAVEIMARDPHRAESLLDDAIAADMFYGPSHNNLGVILLNGGDLHSAAQAFYAATKLMPDSPEPRINLAITMERAGRIAEAMDAYSDALVCHPDHIAVMQALVMCQVRHARRDERTPALLREVSLRGETLEWREWAQRESSRLEDPSSDL